MRYKLVIAAALSIIGSNFTPTHRGSRSIIDTDTKEKLVLEKKKVSNAALKRIERERWLQS
jgi:hypothetical protein